MPYLVVNFLMFQASWFALVAGAANHLLAPGVALCGVFLAWELYRSADRWALASLVGLAVIGGVLVDGSYASFNIVRYALPAGPLAPWWILGLWVIFALTLTESMGWMRERMIVGSLMAGVAAPLSYYAGFKLGAVTFPMGLTTAMLIAAATWMPAIYLLLMLSKRLLPATANEKTPA